ncbi:MAG: hypothetical protein GX958_01490 [Desulfitobacterium sp.]|nr:hypothetical protein [Desulfitobacterium sp.]
MITIDKQLRRYFIAITVVAILVIFLLSNFGMFVFFKNYVQETNLKKDQKILFYIEDLLSTNITTMPGLMQFIRGEAVEVKIYNTEGQLIFDSTSQGMHGGMGMGSGGMGKGHGRMGPGMGMNQNNLQNRAQDSSLELVFRSYPLEIEGQSLGRVEIGRQKSLLAAPEDKSFAYTMNIVYLIALILALIVSVIISKYVTKKFLKPLHQVKDNILSIKRTDTKIQPVNTTTLEIQQLAQATKDLAENIKEQEQLRKRLTSDIAHELRTPLATLQSHLEAMVDGVWEPTPARLSFCNDEVIRLTGLIKDLNELSILESDEVKLQKKQVILSEMLKNLLDNYLLIFSEKDIQLTTDFQQDVTILGDEDRLRQVMVNILSNAYKYTPEKGNVTVELFTKDKWTIIEIRDTGKGIPKEDLAHIFERFYRGDLSRSRESGGSGIGLTIAKALVEAHQGILSIESEVNKGTIVKVQLPRE